ncbi:MAG TPA: FAD-dependent oxidoreductase [Terriglobia bacterium]|nr:FAD-dependent oxidoreductase [Terriglobia bacterium]
MSRSGGTGEGVLEKDSVTQFSFSPVYKIMKSRTKLVDLEWLESNFPCMQACPVHTQAGRYVSLIAEGRYEDAYRYARAPNPFASVCGRVCGHPCETACRRGQLDAPISIRALKRFVTEKYGPESRHPIDVFAERPQITRPEKVAIIGSGPAGLSAAHDLALLGYPVTVFEAAPVPGGMMHLGIPEYRLPRDVLNAQVREILDLGPELRLNSRLGKDFSLADLRAQGYQAILLAFGLHRSRDLMIPGNDLDGVVKGVDFLLNVNLGYRFQIGKRVVVIGGGNVAIDVARSALRRQQQLTLEALSTSLLPDSLNQSELDVAMKELMDVSRQALRMGAREVHLVCLESREEMPAFEEEIEEGMEEGLKIHPSLGPKAFVGKDGKLQGLQTIHCTSVFDANHRFNPTFEAGTESVISCDTAILAIGQASDLSFLTPEDGVETTRQGIIKIDPNTLMSTAPGIFAAGDIAFGPRLIISAVADGKKAAEEIDRYLQGAAWKPKPRYVQITVLDHHQMAEEFDEYSRLSVPVIPIDRRTGIAEVEAGYTEQQARREASRCLKCWINTIFEGNEAEGTECILCGGCVDVCPENCLSLVPLSQFQFNEENKSRLLAEQVFHLDELQHLTAADLPSDEGSVMVKDETICIRCGLCAERCPAKTITMEAFEAFNFDPEVTPVEKILIRA